jgi:hypothetical protein
MLSRYRLHTCTGDKWKEADRVDFETFGYHADGTPAVVFTVTLEQGTDTFGKFALAFGVVEDPETSDEKFAMIDGANQPIVTLDYDDEVDEFLDAVVEKDGYITAINYENKEYYDADGNVGLPMLGRDFGKVFDWVQRDEPLPSGMAETIKNTSYASRGRCGRSRNSRLSRTHSPT